MNRFTIFLVFFVVMATVFVPLADAKSAPPISRRDGFLLMWNSIFRATDTTNEKPFADMKKGDPGFTEITYAKARGIVNDANKNFSPDDPIDFTTAMTWLFRTRSVESPKDGSYKRASSLPDPGDVPALLERFDMSPLPDDTLISRDQLLAYMRFLDGQLTKEVHEVSLYSEKFHGKGTGFGETFDMNALTAAHRSFPYNTLVKVTNVKNGLSVTVRINDRGPFVKGRDMDLSLAAFETIADRASGTIDATFERLGDSTLLNQCHDTRYARRLAKGILLNPGFPHFLALGESIALSSDAFFATVSVAYPDGTVNDTPKWYAPGSALNISPSMTGLYTVVLRDTPGHRRSFTMEVVDCGRKSGL